MNPGFDGWMGTGLQVSLESQLEQLWREAPHPAAQYVVKSGDSLWAIAAAHLGGGILAGDLAKLNQVSPDALLRTGQRLIVPNYQRDDLTAKFMLSEMLVNVDSAAAIAIADAVSRSKKAKDDGAMAIEDIKKSKWYELFRIYGNQEILNAKIRQEGAAKAEAFARWFIQVRQGGPWDHKPLLQKMYANMPMPPRPFGDLGKAYHFPVRGDMFHEYYHDIWSNIHYGFVGARCGIDEATLQSGAASGLPGAGDNDAGDVLSVKIGIDLWAGPARSLTLTLLRQAITTRSADYQAARQGEIKRGIKPEDATLVVITNNDFK